MVNILEVPDINGKIVMINQVDLDKPEAVAKRLGFSVEEFRNLYPSLFAMEERNKGRVPQQVLAV